jgi:5'(3')-deoxyribonucleotidase
VQYSLLNRQRFTKTHLVEQGKTVYKEISTHYDWYLDNLHKDHYEVFNAKGEHIGIANFQGQIDTSKKEKGRRITVN